MMSAPAHGWPRFYEDRRVGGAAAARTDAWLTICHVGNSGLYSVDSVEHDEQRQPLVVHARRLLPDTEGAGTQAGARSCEVEFGPIGCTVSAPYVSDGQVNRPQGGRGGLPGHAASQSRVDTEGRVLRLPNCAQVTVRPGERIRSVSTGGGYGDPRRRDPDLVRCDVAALRISPERARTFYGGDVAETPRPA